MARETYVLRNGKLIPKDKAGPPEGRRGLQIIRDIEPFVSPVDRKVISSRSALREHNKRNGVVQIGNDRLPERKQTHTPLGPDLKAAMQKHGRY